MVFARIVAIGIVMGGLYCAMAQRDKTSAEPMKCETGPVNKTFGGTNWIVYSCDDRISMVVVSAEGNPASPFFFVLKPNDGGYVIMGEGNGDRDASKAAVDALSKMTADELATLLADTKRAISNN